jgi:hypothetical protein
VISLIHILLLTDFTVLYSLRCIILTRKRIQTTIFDFNNNIYCFQFILSLSPPGLPARLISGGRDLFRPLSSGKQQFDTDKTEWPLTKPVPKLEALAQCSGKRLSHLKWQSNIVSSRFKMSFLL